MSDVGALFTALISADEGTEIAVEVADFADAERLRCNLVQRLSSYRKQLEAFMPTDDLPKSLKMKLTGTTAVFTIGARAPVKRRAVSFTILPPSTPASP